MPNPNGGLFSALFYHILSQKCATCQPDFMPNPKDRFPVWGGAAERGKGMRKIAYFFVMGFVVLVPGGAMAGLCSVSNNILNSQYKEYYWAVRTGQYTPSDSMFSLMCVNAAGSNPCYTNDSSNPSELGWVECTKLSGAGMWDSVYSGNELCCATRNTILKAEEILNSAGNCSGTNLFVSSYSSKYWATATSYNQNTNVNTVISYCKAQYNDACSMPDTASSAVTAYPCLGFSTYGLLTTTSYANYYCCTNEASVNLAVEKAQTPVSNVVYPCGTNSSQCSSAMAYGVLGQLFGATAGVVRSCSELGLSELDGQYCLLDSGAAEIIDTYTCPPDQMQLTSTPYQVDGQTYTRLYNGNTLVYYKLKGNNSVCLCPPTHWGGGTTVLNKNLDLCQPCPCQTAENGEVCGTT